MNGSVTSWQEAQVSAEISGLRIKQVLVDVGSEVKHGQVMALLEDETVLVDLRKQQAIVARDRASLAEAKSNADRARDIKDSGALSTQQINQYLIAEETAQANLALSQAELENQQIRLRQTRLTAADDGVVSSRSANLGNVVSAGTELFRLIRQGRIEWRGEVNAQQLAVIKKGQKVKLILPDNRQVTGVVRMIAPTLDTNTRNALIYVDIPKLSAEPGVYAQGIIDIGSKTAITIPQTSLVLRDGRSYVYEIANAKDNANSQAHRVIQRSVITGRRVGDRIEILEGLASNTLLVATGGAFLNDGDLVTVVSDGSQAEIKVAP
jgi:RND family efflux transporter MFP subunit